ncbi:uncharacterized protein LOC122089616 [Macadamia integrifolia]|uniref:uncharacterized protein LOC122089616 n=1 Tax=Macadamia integrifolia TaxID=60698 RepID=UPI001C500A7E|nr:uncharacterized protein LOC122089616 [Macadamia integrifolia]
MDKYFHFHMDHSHDTENYWHLKGETESMIRRGYLGRFVDCEKEDPQDDNDRRDNHQREGKGCRESRGPACRDNQERRRDRTPKRTNPCPQDDQTIMISGGMAVGESSVLTKKAKAYARSVHVTEWLNKKAKIGTMISLSDDDLEGVQTPYDDALVITMTLADSRVKRILVDNGSSVDILFLEVFQKMGLSKEKLKKVEHPLQGFSGASVKVEGSYELPVRAGTRDRHVTVMIIFLVVDITSAYNAILERVRLNLLKAIVSTSHLKMKFPTKNGVGECRGDQKTSQRCYATTLWGKEKAGEALPIEGLRNDPNHQRGELTEDLI